MTGGVVLELIRLNVPEQLMLAFSPSVLGVQVDQVPQGDQEDPET